jgi:hypothetical protein
MCAGELQLLAIFLCNQVAWKYVLTLNLKLGMCWTAAFIILW